MLNGDDVTTISHDAVGAAGPGVYVVGVGGRTALADRDPLMDMIMDMMWSLADHGWRPLTVDAGTTDDKSALIDTMARGLGAPEWFGHNWDAVVDLLRDRADQQPLAIVVAPRESGLPVGDPTRNLQILADIVAELISEGSRLKLVRVIGDGARVRDL